MRVGDIDIVEERRLDLRAAALSNAYLKVRGLEKCFREQGGLTTVLGGLDLDVSEGEFVSIYGPNGCGKTTLLRILANLDHDWRGDISLGGNTPADVECGCVFQDYQRSLLPWLTNLQNLCLPLEIVRGLSRAESEQSVKKFLDRLTIKKDWLYKYPYKSNAGEQQLVSILRAFVFSPRLVLMDEPFSSLDFHNQLRLREVLLELWQETGQTILFVSHSLEDSVYLADRLVVFSPKPARVLLNVGVPLARPRRPDMGKSGEFSEIVNKVRRLLVEEILP